MPIRQICPALAAALLVMAASACAAPATSPDVPPTPAPTTTVPRTTAPPTTAPPTAADGADLSACADGECEVLVDATVDIPVAPGSGFRSIRLLAGPSGPELEVLGLAGQGGTISGSGCTSYAEGGVVEFESVDADTAIVRVGTGECSPP